MGRIRPATRPGARTGSRPPSSRTGCGCSSGGAPASRRASRIRRPARARRVPRCPREPRRRSWSSSSPEPHGGGMKARKRVRVIPRPCAATAGPWQHAPVDRRPAVGLAVLAFSFGCRSAPPPQYPGSLIAVTVRLWPMLPRAGHVTASADTGGAALTLRTGLAPAELTGSIPVRPGAHTVAIEAFDGAGIRIGAASFSVTCDRGFPALLDATVLLAATQQAKEGRPILGGIVAPRSSVVQGDRMLLQARTADPPAAVALAWSAVPSGCGAFRAPRSLDDVHGDCRRSLYRRARRGGRREAGSPRRHAHRPKPRSVIPIPVVGRTGRKASRRPEGHAARAYDVEPARPVYLLESDYEHEHPDQRTQPFPKAWWWTMLSGGSGVFWSNTFLWMCESARGVYALEYGDVDHAVSSWSAELDSEGTFQALHLHP